MKTVSTYHEAATLMGRRNRRVIAKNTRLERDSDGNIDVILHGTAVVTMRVDGLYVLRSGGWRTLTTKQRINSFSPARLYQKNYDWFLYIPGGSAAVPFVEGMLVDSAGLPIGHHVDSDEVPAEVPAVVDNTPDLFS